MYLHVDSKINLKSGMVIQKESYKEHELILPEIKQIIDAGFYSHLVKLADEGLSLWGFSALTLQKGGADVSMRMRELTFELYRWKQYPHKPSRLQCLFAWADINSAKTFKEHHGGQIFEVSVSGNMPEFIADENVFDSGEYGLYWQGRTLSNDKDYVAAKECLLSLPVKVLRSI